MWIRIAGGYRDHARRHERGVHGDVGSIWTGVLFVAQQSTRSDPAGFQPGGKNGTFAGTTTVAAKPGDVIILWGTGFGPTDPVAPQEKAVPSDTTYSTTAVPAVTINNISAKVFGAALAPGFGGLYQIAIQVPNALADGDWPIQASISGLQSPSGTVLSVHQ